MLGQSKMFIIIPRFEISNPVGFYMRQKYFRKRAICQAGEYPDPDEHRSNEYQHYRTSCRNSSEQSLIRWQSFPGLKFSDLFKVRREGVKHRLHQRPASCIGQQPAAAIRPINISLPVGGIDIEPGIFRCVLFHPLQPSRSSSVDHHGDRVDDVCAQRKAPGAPTDQQGQH